MNAKWLVERLRAAAAKVHAPEAKLALTVLADEIEAESDRLRRADWERTMRREVSDEEWDRVKGAWE